jgi:hypothetical protein
MISVSLRRILKLVRGLDAASVSVNTVGEKKEE